MITSKQRSYLKGLAQQIKPTVFMGKQGLTDNVIKELETGFETRELIKVKLQEGCELNPKDIANELAEKMNAEFVQAIGNKFILYRQAKDKEKRKIEFPRK